MQSNGVDYTAIEGPLNMLAGIVGEKRGVEFGRPIRITTEVSDISVRKYEIRIHPDMVDGQDLFVLLNDCYSLIEELEDVPRRMREEAISTSRAAILYELRYLWRADPLGTLDFLGTLSNGSLSNA